MAEEAVRVLLVRGGSGQEEPGMINSLVTIFTTLGVGARVQAHCG